MDQALASTLSPLVNGTTAAAVNPVYTYAPATPSSNNYRYGDKLIVTLSYNHPMFFNLIGQNITLTAHSEMRLEPGGR